MSKLYYKIQKELLKQLNETTNSPVTLSNEEKQALDKKVLELADNEAYIKPILALVVKYLKTQKDPEKLAQFQKTATMVVGNQKKQPFSTFLAVWMAFRNKQELANEWNTFINKTQDFLQKQQKDLLQDENLWNSVDGQIYFIFHLYDKLDKRDQFRSTGDFTEEIKKAARNAVDFSNTKVAQTRFHKAILETLKKLLGRVGQKDPDTKTPALNFQAAYLPILSRFQSTIDRLIAKNEKELQQPGAANKTELTNNLEFLKTSEEVVEAIRDYISLKRPDPAPAPLQEEEKDPPPTDFIGSYGEEGDFTKVLGALKKLEKFVPGISTFFNDMGSTDLDEIGRSKELQKQLQKAIRATLSTVGREVDKFSGKGRFSVTAGELKAVLEKYEVKDNIEPIINNTVRAYKALAEKISSKETVKDFLEAIAKNASKIAPKEIQLGKQMEDLPDKEKPVKIALEVLEGKHFEKIKKTEDSIQSIGNTTKKDKIQNFYDKKKSKLRSKFALFYDKKSTQKQVAFEFEDDNQVLNLKVDGKILKFTEDSLLPALSEENKNTFEQDLETYKEDYKNLLKLDMKLDFKGEARVGIGSEQKEIKMFKFFNGKFEGYEDPETVSPANFIFELLENEEQGRPYGDAIVKFSGEVNTSAIEAVSNTDFQYFKADQENFEHDDNGNIIKNGTLLSIINDPRLKILFNKFIYNLSLELEHYYKEKEKMNDLFELFLKLYKEENIDPNKRSDIIALGVVFNRNFRVESFQEVTLENKVELLKRLLEKTLPGLKDITIKAIDNAGIKFDVEAKNPVLPWDKFEKNEDQSTATGYADRVYEKYKDKEEHKFKFELDFTETEPAKMAEKQEETFGELWKEFDLIRDYITFAFPNLEKLDFFQQGELYRQLQTNESIIKNSQTIDKNLTSKLETLINEFINKRKQQWRKRTM